MTKVALLNAPSELMVGRALIQKAKARLEKLEHVILHTDLPHEHYLTKRARTDELRALIGDMERFVDQKERET